MSDEKYNLQRNTVRVVFNKILSALENKIGQDRIHFNYLGEDFDVSIIGRKDYVTIWPKYTIEWSSIYNGLPGLSDDEHTLLTDEIWKIKNLSDMFNNNGAHFSILPSIQLK